MKRPGEEVITSLQNPRIKEAVRLLDRRARKRTGRTRIDGARELLRALDGGVRPEALYVCEELVRPGEGAEALQRCRQLEVPIWRVSAELSARLAFGDRNEGLCAIIRWQPLAFDELTIPDDPLLLVVQAVEKPGNLGALLRTADAAGVDAVLLCDAVTDATNPNAIRASMGTIFTVPLAQGGSADAWALLQAHRVRVSTTRPEASTSYWEADLTGPLALVVGAEHEGLGESWQQEEITALRIPMAGAADSLNVNVAAALVLFEARRQRSRQRGESN